MAKSNLQKSSQQAKLTCEGPRRTAHSPKHIRKHIRVCSHTLLKKMLALNMDTFQHYIH